jgi:hypothetical protein
MVSVLPAYLFRVAQIFNLLYRRFVIGKARLLPTLAILPTIRGLQTRDTADCKSALRARTETRQTHPLPAESDHACPNELPSRERPTIS